MESARRAVLQDISNLKYVDPKVLNRVNPQAKVTFLEVALIGNPEGMIRDASPDLQLSLLASLGKSSHLFLKYATTEVRYQFILEKGISKEKYTDKPNILGVEYNRTVISNQEPVAHERTAFDKGLLRAAAPDVQVRLILDIGEVPVFLTILSRKSEKLYLKRTLKFKSVTTVDFT